MIIDNCLIQRQTFQQWRDSIKQTFEGSLITFYYRQDRVGGKQEEKEQE